MRIDSSEINFCSMGLVLVEVIVAIKRLLKRLIFGYKADSDTYLAALRKMGMKIGDGVYLISSPRDCVIDEQNPYLITIGDNVQLTRGVLILTHDYSWSVVKGCYGEVLGHQAPVSIGNNVFIGMNAVILAGSTIGDNVIVGAGSIISGTIPPNVVVAGNPAKVLCTIDEYRVKRKSKQLSEAVDLYTSYLKRYGHEPEEVLFREYFWLFESALPELPSEFVEVNGYVDPFLTEHEFADWTPEFDGFEAFENYCLSRMSIED